MEYPINIDSSLRKDVDGQWRSNTLQANNMGGA